jgi:hypothetical protein
VKIAIPFIDQNLEIDIPASSRLFDVSPADSPPVLDFKEEITAALQNPEGTKPLA